MESALHLMINRNDDRSAAFEEAVRFLHTYYSPAMTREHIEGWLACGPSASVIEKTRAYVDTGCTTPILRFASWDQKGQLARALADVMPRALALPLPAGPRGGVRPCSARAGTAGGVPARKRPLNGLPSGVSEVHLLASSGARKVGQARAERALSSSGGVSRRGGSRQSRAVRGNRAAGALKRRGSRDPRRRRFQD
jgi:hypothetical protein